MNFKKPYYENCLQMNGENIFNFTMKEVPVLINKNLVKNNFLSVNDVQYFIFHQANAFMLNAIRRKCKIPKEKFIIEIENTANTVSSTIPIAFQKTFYLDRNINLKDCQNIMLVGFGVGLSMASCIVYYESN